MSVLSSSSHPDGDLGFTPFLSEDEESHANLCVRETQGWYFDLRSFALSLGNDVQLKAFKNYTSFKRTHRGAKTFAWFNCRPSFSGIDIDLRQFPDGEPDGVFMAPLTAGGFRKELWKVRVRSAEDVKRAKDVLAKSYHAS